MLVLQGTSAPAYAAARAVFSERSPATASLVLQPGWGTGAPEPRTHMHILAWPLSKSVTWGPKPRFTVCKMGCSGACTVGLSGQLNEFTYAWHILSVQEMLASVI